MRTPKLSVSKVRHCKTERNAIKGHCEIFNRSKLTLRNSEYNTEDNFALRRSACLEPNGKKDDNCRLPRF